MKGGGRPKVKTRLIICIEKSICESTINENILNFVNKFHFPDLCI